MTLESAGRATGSLGRGAARRWSARGALAAALACSLQFAAPAAARAVTLAFNGTTQTFDPDVDLAGQEAAFAALRDAPDSESDAVIALLIGRANELSPLFLYELARRLWPRDPDTSFEWLTVALVRSTYDAGRCVGDSAGSALEYFYFAYAANVREGSLADVPAALRSATRALARPDLFAGTVSPRWICAYVRGPARAIGGDTVQPDAAWLRPESEWAAVRDWVRDDFRRRLERAAAP